MGWASSGSPSMRSSQTGNTWRRWFPTTDTYSSRPSMYCSTIALVPTLSWTNATRSRSFSSLSTTDAWAMPRDASSVSDLTISGKDRRRGRRTARPIAKTAKSGHGIR